MEARGDKRWLTWLTSHREVIAAVAGLVILGLALVALSGLLKEIRAGDIRRAIAAIGPSGWVMAAGFTLASYTCLTLYDVIALRVIGARLPYALAARAAATSYAISNTLGLSLLTGGTVRMRIYGRAGLGEADVARVIALASATFWLGIFVLFGLAIALEPAGFRLGQFAIPAAVRWGVPVATLLVLGSYLAWSAATPRALHAFGASLPMPRPRQTLLQLAIAAVDLAASAAVIFVLVPDITLAHFPQFLVAYILALGAAVLTHSPGGLGVFETIIFLLLPQIGKSELAAALIGYRLVYYLIPFIVALVAMAVSEGDALRRRAAPVAKVGQAMAVSLAPRAMAGLVFVAGAVLILTAAVPAIPERVDAVLTILPPVLLDLSHFASSILGTVLMFVAYGLARRLDVAWLAAMVVLALGSLSALLRGFDFEEAGTLALVMALLAWTRPAFYRQSALTTERLGPLWLLAIATVLATTLFLGLFAYKHVDYSTELWWQVHPAGDAPRFLRATLGAVVLGFVLALNRLTRPRREPADFDLDAAIWQKALAHTARTEAHLARTGDKAFIVADTRDAFLMYRVRGRSFIAMGDPVGPSDRWPELAWRLRELADRQGGRVAFYECGPDFLPIAVDLGLGIMKLGEEALVPLADFSLAGRERANLRHAVNRMEREHVTFRMAEGAALAALMPELQAVSDEWLASKKQREKQFSLGRFRCRIPAGHLGRAGRARRPNPGVRQPVAAARPAGIVLRPHAPAQRSATRHDGLPVRATPVVGAGQRIWPVVARRCPPVRHRKPPAGAIVGADRGRGLSPRRAPLRLYRAAPIQGKIPARMAGPLFRRPARAPDGSGADRRHAAGVRARYRAPGSRADRRADSPNRRGPCAARPRRAGRSTTRSRRPDRSSMMAHNLKPRHRKKARR